MNYIRELLYKCVKKIKLFYGAREIMPEILQKVCMAGITGFFNAQYLSEHPNYKEYWHEGVDLAVGAENCGLIGLKSGVSGKVIIEGDKGNYSYGCFIVIKADTKFEGKYTRYYLLGHLDRTKTYKHEKQYIFPGEIVGYVGNTGHCKGRDANGVLWDLDGNDESSAKTKARNDGVGSHLHLQLYLSTLSETNFLSEAESGLAKHKNDEIAIVIKNKGIVNPFNYYEKYIRDTKK